MCFVWLSEQTITFVLYAFNRLVFITVVESVYSAVRTVSLYKADTVRPLKVKLAAMHVGYLEQCKE
jgi:hypothetical protein